MFRPAKAAEAFAEVAVQAAAAEVGTAVAVAVGPGVGPVERPSALGLQRGSAVACWACFARSSALAGRGCGRLP